jgi:hypothetical protein
VVLCANRDNAGVRKNAQKNIDSMKANHQKRHWANTNKRKNFRPANFGNFDKAGQKCIRKQVLQDMNTRKIINIRSITLSVTTPSTVATPVNPDSGRG